LTKEPAEFEQAEVKAKADRLGSLAELDMGLATKRLGYHSPVHFWDEPNWVYTTAGRVIFNSILPEGIRREGFRNQVMRKRDRSDHVRRALQQGDRRLDAREQRHRGRHGEDHAALQGRLQPGVHDVRLREPRVARPDPPAGGDARPDGEAAEEAHRRYRGDH